MTLLAAWGITQWVIVLVIALLLFGGSRLAGLGKGVGRSIREFKEEVKSVDDGNPDAEVVEAEIVSTDVRNDPVDARMAELEARERQLAEREAELQRQREAGTGN